MGTRALNDSRLLPVKAARAMRVCVAAVSCCMRTGLIVPLAIPGRVPAGVPGAHVQLTRGTGLAICSWWPAKELPRMHRALHACRAAHGAKTR